MAFPWLSEATFEANTVGHFDTEADDSNKLSIAHYSELARYPYPMAPYRGAYCVFIDQSIGTATDAAYLQETGSWDLIVTADEEIYLKMMFWFGGPVVMADTNEFAIAQFWSSTSTAEGGAYINYTTANGYRIGIGETAATSFLPLTLNRWHCLELFLDPGAASAGTLDGWLDGVGFTQVTALTQADITSGIVGASGLDAGTTGFYLLIDDVVTDDAQVFPPERRFPQTRLLTQSEHIFVGPGEIANVTLLCGAGTDNVLTIYDTDNAYTSDASNVVAILNNTANSEVIDLANVPVEVQRGAYVALSGTNPRALVQIRRAAGYWSDAGIRNVGHRRTPRKSLS